MWSLYCDLSATLWKWSSELLILHTNIADKHSTITGTGIMHIPDQVILYNFLSMLPQSYRHYPTYLIRAFVTSIIHREVLLYLIMYQFIYSVINGFNVLQ